VQQIQPSDAGGHRDGRHKPDGHRAADCAEQRKRGIGGHGLEGTAA
jgi:hypothetical protein